MKTRVLGMVLASCMAMSMFASAADAANNNAVGDAGASDQTMTCDITYFRASGDIQTKTIEIDVPANTARTNVQETILHEAENAMFPAREARYSNTLYQENGKYFPATNTSEYDGEAIVANFKLDRAYTMLSVVFSDVSPYPTSISCRLVDVNVGFSKTLYNNQAITGSSRTCKVSFVEDAATDGGGNVPKLTSGKNFNVMASCKTSNPPLGGIADVLVSGYYRVQ